MTHLFACICNQPQHLSEGLAPVRSLLVTGAPITRWGIAYVQAGEVLLSRNPRSSEEPVDLFAAIESLPSDYVIAHASPASAAPQSPGNTTAGNTGNTGNSANTPGASRADYAGSANTAPFRYRNWMFAMDDMVAADSERFSELIPSVLEYIPNHLRRTIRGKTPAEHLFGIFLALLHDAGRIDDPNLETAVTRRALRDAIGHFASCFTGGSGSNFPPALTNIAISNSRTMLAVRLGQPLYMRRLKVPVSRRELETFKGVLTLSAATDPGEGFEEIPLRSVIAISRDVRTDIVGLDE